MSNQFDTILCETEPRGKFRECIISGTPKPGTCMTVKAATEPVNNIWTYEAFNRDADGNQAEVAVLLEDELQGQLITTAYAASDQARIYFPQAGDMLQMLVANIAGTGDSFAIGDYLIIDDGTGKLIATTGSPEMESFKVMETQAVLTADLHVLCMYTGH